MLGVAGAIVLGLGVFFVSTVMDRIGRLEEEAAPKVGVHLLLSKIRDEQRSQFEELCSFLNGGSPQFHQSSGACMIGSDKIYYSEPYTEKELESWFGKQ